MVATTGIVERPGSAVRAVGYAAVGPLIMASALGLPMAVARWMPGDGWFGRVLQTAPTCVIAVALLLVPVFLVLAALCFLVIRWMRA
ncbi:hypothetical protein [Nocardia terpenica]|uniref:Uncharacterized protein n=1 Tax=Nocardia terpenica TaxID=455432 RepID=A0A6G9ZD39_9NOCA|nr:hypothetical protein [Nocardia terpenica]QIS23267.1 hypothetical protein F6W96_37970 [Nocardia terpenica]